MVSISFGPMPAIHVRDVPPEVIAALKRRAAASRRSMQREILDILVAATRDAPVAPPVAPISLVVADAPATGEWAREEMYGDDGR